ncbi:MAG: sigma-54-dependent Fis family transcriptional regulator [Desulfomonile tiedjei]|uniref:Sigma-54-dependent Fis family transcriptional regulator n=1 Tax=Desulfomonile tiedjei TaxID=2358 RepID=A0A9D6Z3R9_9BACT|nr:sigma-54-dependent Fis family transcriptional regulator [Desulfomonile tiedjei]
MPDQPHRILIVDDEPNMLHMLSSILKQAGFEPTCAEDARRALELVDDGDFDFILSDVRMPGMDGIQLVENLRSRRIDSIVILMSAYGNVGLALEAIRKGAYDYISKPFKTDEVVLTLRKAAEREKLRREVVRLKRRLLRTEGNPEIVIKSRVMRSVLETLHQIAGFDCSVLITGESGTGKELLAREAHTQSQFSHGPFVPINCGAIPGNLLETELFGHARGAFTGASNAKAGLFEEADGGTLFLDEIGAMDFSLQVKILRAIDTREIRRIGENTGRKVSVRILAATNEDLEPAMERGAFRRDLFYRLNVVHIHIPPLRERREDIVPLVEHFVSLYNRKMGRSVARITREAQDALLGYTWKGNVRELQNVVERAMILTTGDAITLESLPHDIRVSTSRIPGFTEQEETLSLKRASKELEKNFILRALNRTAGNRSQAAALLEISYPSLLQKIKDYGIT